MGSGEFTDGNWESRRPVGRGLQPLIYALCTETLLIDASIKDTLYPFDKTYGHLKVSLFPESRHW